MARASSRRYRPANPLRMIPPSRDAQARLDCPAASVPGRPVNDGEQCVDIKRKVSSEHGSAATFTGEVHVDRPIAPSSGRGDGLENCHFPAWRSDGVAYPSKGPDFDRHRRLGSRSEGGRTDRGDSPWRRRLDPARREALARRLADRRHDPCRHKRGADQLDGQGHRRTIRSLNSCALVYPASANRPGLPSIPARTASI